VNGTLVPTTFANIQNEYSSQLVPILTCLRQLFASQHFHPKSWPTQHHTLHYTVNVALCTSLLPSDKSGCSPICPSIWVTYFKNWHANDLHNASAPVDTSVLHQKSALMQQRRLRHLLDKLNPTGLRKPPSERARKVHPKVLGPLHADRSDQPSRLLRLPVEIRTIIWTPVMTMETGKLHYNAEKNGFIIVSPYQSWRWKVPGLLMTCHQVALSALSLYLKYFRGQRMRCSLRSYCIQRRRRRVGDRLF
jgi:hypothetical protein